MDRCRIAFVVQRYGEEVNGGAELHCRWVAEHLALDYDVHVITTCARDYIDWKDYYAPGESVIGGVTVHRFAVDQPRDWSHFQKLTVDILNRPHTFLNELRWMEAQGPLSSGLLRFLEEKRDSFAVIFFFTYLYATTFYGLPLAPERAALVPTAHEEPTLHLPLYRSIFHLPRAILYNTETERETVEQIVHNRHIPNLIVGTGIQVPDDICAQRFRDRYGIQGDFVLYVGRIDHSKNCAELMQYFARFRPTWPGSLKLVMLGRPVIPLLQHPDIIAPGFVSEQDKFDAIQAASVVAAPSLYESLSMIVLEAWLAGTPVLVNGHCEVLKQQCLKSNGGLYYQSFDEFRVELGMLLERPWMRQSLALQGKQFTVENYHWDRIMAKYRQVIDQFEKSDLGLSVPRQA